MGRRVYHSKGYGTPLKRAGTLDFRILLRGAVRRPARWARGRPLAR
jgi:hypothetical protein